MPFASLLGSTAASAQEAEAADATPAQAPGEETVEAPAAPEPSAPAPATAADATKATSAPAGPVEWLPASAYPEWTTRGIDGGSLKLSGSMHGMPWPYTPRTGVGISGGVWVDTGYETIDRGNPTQASLKYLVNQGRATVRVTPTYSADELYVQGQVELIGNADQTRAQPAVADVDDLWIRFGAWKKWDVQLGRFEAFEVYHFGMGLDLNTLERQGAYDEVRSAPDVYGLTTIVVRQSTVGNVAFHFYPTRNLRFELLGQLGFDPNKSLNTVGARPAAVLDFDWVKLKAAVDVRKQSPIKSSSKESLSQRGGMAALQFVIDPVLEFGGNFSYGLIDHYNALNVTDPNAERGDFDGLGSPTLWAAGGFANVRLFERMLAGAGVNFAHETDQVEGEFTNLQAFGALQYLLGGQLYIKAVGAYAKAHIAPGGKDAWDNKMLSGRLRLMYLF